VTAAAGVLVECMVAGCGARHPSEHAMCRRHWTRVPAALQSALWAAWRSEPGSPAHVDLLARAWAAAGALPRTAPDV